MRAIKKEEESLTEQQYLICPAHINHYGRLLAVLKKFPMLILRQTNSDRNGKLLKNAAKYVKNYFKLTLPKPYDKMTQ